MQEEKVRILIVDDDESIRKTLTFILLDRNFDVETAENGENALKKVGVQFFNIAIVDYGLPDTDGVRLGKNIKRISIETEVIILTGMASLESAISAVKENIYDYLTKPVNPDKLIGVINSALEKQRLILENKMLFWELKMSNKKLERLNKFKDGVISMISHDLRSPISSLKGFNYSLLGGYCGELTEEQKKVIEIEDETINTMMELINNLLDMRQIEAGELKMKKEPVDMVKTIEPVIRILAPQINEKKLDVNVNCEENLPLVDMDAGRISQVVRNLLQNAIKFTPKEGRVEINLTKTENQQIELQVKDTGKGIQKEFLDTIFEVFYTEDDSSKVREKTGRGLGLAICKEIMRAHAGLIWAESEGLGFGSTFTVVLPIEK